MFNFFRAPFLFAFSAGCICRLRRVVNRYCNQDSNKVVENSIAFLVAALDVVVMVGLAARKVIIRNLRASSGSCHVEGDAGAEEGEEVGTQKSLRGVFEV